MSVTVRSPSHRPRTAAAVPFRTVTDSGVSSTCRSRAASKVSRTYGARHGWSAPLPVWIGPVDGIEHAPQDVALEGQRRHRRGLLLGGPAALRHHLQRVLGVARGLGQTPPEIAEPGRVDPGVVAL